MEAIVIRVRLDSTTLVVPELAAHIGKSVELRVHVEDEERAPFSSSPNASSRLLEEGLLESGGISRLA
ncbi:MAG TPA: hypothetical protein VHE30_17790 [Polyangiaceae bacterium]|nr:hypothetical protein [Polyangiaceae bacterium]